MNETKTPTYKTIILNEETKDRIDKIVFARKAKGEKMTFDSFINELLDK